MDLLDVRRERQGHTLDASWIRDVIRCARITSGWPVKNLEAFKKKGRFEFTDGANVIYGKNGSGKTTLLKLMGAHSGCPEYGGWSTFPEWVFLPVEKERSLPGCLTHLARLGPDVEATVDWDGAATFMHLAAKSDEPFYAFGSPHDVLTTYGDQVSAVVSKASSGQARAMRLAMVLKKVKTERPDLMKLEARRDRDTAFLEYVEKLPRKGPLTVLLDEPERSLDADAQILFWQTILPAMAKELQVIVTSHSPFALFVPGVHVIDMEPGYSDEMRKKVGRLLDDWRARTK